MHTDSDIPTKIPNELTAGDRWRWKISGDHYPAPAWTLKYSFRNASAAIDITAAADGSDHLIDVASASSADYAAGDYDYQAYMDSGTERHAIDSGRLTILPDFEASAPIDQRSHAQIVLDKIEAVIEGRASRDDASYSIAGRTLSRMPTADLLALRDTYRAEVAAEDRKRRIGRGEAVKNRIVTRFK